MKFCIVSCVFPPEPVVVCERPSCKHRYLLSSSARGPYLSRLRIEILRERELFEFLLGCPPSFVFFTGFEDVRSILGKYFLRYILWPGSFIFEAPRRHLCQHLAALCPGNGLAGLSPSPHPPCPECTGHISRIIAHSRSSSSPSFLDLQDSTRDGQIRCATQPCHHPDIREIQAILYTGTRACGG